MFKGMFVELFVTDVEAAAQFFEHALGFERGYTLVEEGVLDFVVMEHRQAKQQLLLHHMMPDSEADKPRYMRLWFEPEDIDRVYAELKEKGYECSPPEPTDYGAIEAHFRGPDGYEIWLQQWQPAAVSAQPQAD